MRRACTSPPLATDPGSLYAGLSSQNEQVGDVIGGGLLILLNNTSKGNGSTDLELGSRTDIGTDHQLAAYSLRNVSIVGFDVARRMNTYNHYLGTFINFNEDGNTIGVDVGTDGNASNSGENFSHRHCVFSNNGIDINMNVLGIDMSLTDCSFDGNGTLAVLKTAYGYGRYLFVGGHIEGINPDLLLPTT